MTKARNLIMAAMGLMPLASAAASPQPAASGDDAQAKRPNIIFIMCDDMGYADLGCYGQQKIETPNLDRMAQEGMRFTQAYAGSPVSAPSRATFMTGQHAGRVHVRGNKEYWQSALRQNAFGSNADYSIIGQEPYLMTHRILPEVMKEAGYTTGMFGKWAGGYYNMNHPNTYAVDENGNTDTSKSATSSSSSLPNKRGIDCYYGYICQFQAHTYYPNFLNRYDPEKYGDKYVVVDTLKQNIQHKDVASANKDYENREQYTSDLIHEYALDWIDRQTGEQPFMGIFTYTLPHAELWQPNDSLLQKYTEKFKGQDSNFGGAFSSWYYRNYGRRAQFAAMVSRLDAQVGEIFDKLKEKGFDENTLVIFTSDNGPHEEGGADPAWFNHDGLLRGTKRSTHEGGIRVPFIAKGPGVPAGTTNDHQLAFYDVMPTLLDYAGFDGSEYSLRPEDEDCQHDGISFCNTLTGNDKEQEKHEFLYWEFHETNMMAVRMGDWKLVVKNGVPKLYDLATDLHEDHDLAEKRPDIVATMVEIIHQQHTESSMFRVTLPERRRTGEFVSMTFQRPETGAPVVDCVNERNEAPLGLKASVVDMHPAQQTKSWTGAAVRGRRDLTPGTNVADTVRYVTFRVDGLPSDYAIGSITAEIAGISAAGNYWTKAYDFDFTFSVQTSKNGTDWVDFDTKNGNIVQTLGESTEWTFSSEEAVSSGSPFYFRVCMVSNSAKYKTYSSLFSVILQRDPNAETSVSEIEADQIKVVSGTFDLSGRPVSSTSTGVVVEDGKLIIKAPAPSAQ